MMTVEELVDYMLDHAMSRDEKVKAIKAFMEAQDD